MSAQIAKQIIACVMKRRGKEEVVESDFYLTISMQFQWCSPQLAKQFMHHALKDSLLVQKGNLISASFNVNSVNVPVGFKPNLDFFKNYEPKQSSLDAVIKTDLFSYVTSNIQCSIQEMQISIDNIINEKNVSRNVALLLFAKKNNIQINEYISVVEEELLKELS